MTETATGPPRVLLIGMMGAGKSRTGALVASRLGWPHADSDELVEQRTGNTVTQIFESQGEATFRTEESRALADAVGAAGPVVVSVAGGAVLSADNRQLVREAGLVVWLRASLETLGERVVGGQHRPLLEGDPLRRLSELYAARRPWYQELADVVVDVDGLSPDEVAEQVVTAFHAAVARAPVGRGSDA